MKENMKISMEEDIQTNKKSVRIDKMSGNVYMQVSSEQARVAESKYVSCQNQALKSVQLCNNVKVTLI